LILDTNNISNLISLVTISEEDSSPASRMSPGGFHLPRNKQRSASQAVPFGNSRAERAAWLPMDREPRNIFPSVPAGRPSGRDSWLLEPCHICRRNKDNSRFGPHFSGNAGRTAVRLTQVRNKSAALVAGRSARGCLPNWHPPRVGQTRKIDASTAIFARPQSRMPCHAAQPEQYPCKPYTVQMIIY
jgi:hypothetical protein